LTLDRVILHTVMHHSSTSTCIPNVIEIEETFCGRADVHLRPTILGRLRGVDLKSENWLVYEYIYNKTFSNCVSCQFPLPHLHSLVAVLITAI